MLLCLSLLLLACNNYEKENTRLKEEMRMLREENGYLKAEIVGLKKAMGELSRKVKEEREALETRLREEREALQKRAQEAEKREKNGNGGKNHSPKDTAAAKKEQTGKESETVKRDQVQKNVGAGVKETKEAGPRSSQDRVKDGRTQHPESPGGE